MKQHVSVVGFFQELLFFFPFMASGLAQVDFILRILAQRDDKSGLNNPPLNKDLLSIDWEHGGFFKFQ